MNSSGRKTAKLTTAMNLVSFVNAVLRKEKEKEIIYASYYIYITLHIYEQWSNDKADCLKINHWNYTQR